jgi:serine/threonine protein kinase
VSAPEWAQVKELLHRAVALGPELRAKFLDEACASDAALRAELESLLSVGDELSAEFLQSPPQFPGVVEGPGATEVELGAAGLAAGQLLAERYRLIRRLGEGGMGQVWLAEQTLPVRRLVALKLIRAGMYDEAVVRRFQSERQSLAIMDHPAIAKVFDAGATPQGQPYLVMEYVPGLPITEYCDQHRLKIPERLELFIRACEGVQHAHQKAIIHRDLKPANILIVEVDGEPTPRIIDFGLAKATTVQLTEETLHTRIGQFLGTPGYMSPEQVDPNIQDVDTRTDVYSLGVILYVLLTGLQPFETKRREKPPLDVWLRQLREEEPPSPSTKLSSDPDTASVNSAARGTAPKQLASELKGDLDWIAMKTLERDRERRYSTPTELAADLRHYLNHEPVTARPTSAGYQLAKYIRRHRIATLVTAIVVLLGLITSVAGLVAVRKEREAEFQTAQAREAQSRALTQAAAQRLRDQDIEGARLRARTLRGRDQYFPGNPRVRRAARGAFRPQRSAPFCRLLARRHPHRDRLQRQHCAHLGCAHGRSARGAPRPWRSRRIRCLFARRHTYRHCLTRQDRAHLGCAHGRAARPALRPRSRLYSRLLARRHAHRDRLARQGRAHLGCTHRG